jgi:hypothetical protein
MMQIDTGSGST